MRGKAWGSESGAWKRRSTTASFEQAVRLWENIPGVDHVATSRQITEVGVNMAQFPSAHHLASWAAVCPGNNQSTGKCISGPRRDGNKWLRRTLCQVAWAVTGKKDGYLSAQFQRLAARRGMKRAVMAVAHYHEPGGGYLEQINKEQVQSYFVKRLQRLGLTVHVQRAAGLIFEGE